MTEFGELAGLAVVCNLSAARGLLIDGLPADSATPLARLDAAFTAAIGEITVARGLLIDGIPIDPATETTLAVIQAKTDLLNSAVGTSTLNDANTSDAIVPAALPTNLHVTFDISNLNNNLDDFTIQVSVGVAASERVVAWYKLTSDGTDITCDAGSGVGVTIKQRKIDISSVLVYTGEQAIVSLTKNGATDRNVVYKYAGGA